MIVSVLTAAAVWQELFRYRPPGPFVRFVPKADIRQLYLITISHASPSGRQSKRISPFSWP